MEGSQITSGRGRPEKTIRETIKTDLEINELDRNMAYDRTLWCSLIHVANPTQWDKALSVVVVVDNIKLLTQIVSQN